MDNTSHPTNHSQVRSGSVQTNLHMCQEIGNTVGINPGFSRASLHLCSMRASGEQKTKLVESRVSSVASKHSATLPSPRPREETTTALTFLALRLLSSNYDHHTLLLYSTN